MEEAEQEVTCALKGTYWKHLWPSHAHTEVPFGSSCPTQEPEVGLQERQWEFQPFSLPHQHGLFATSVHIAGVFAACTDAEGHCPWAKPCGPQLQACDFPSSFGDLQP